MKEERNTIKIVNAIDHVLNGNKNDSSMIICVKESNEMAVYCIGDTEATMFGIATFITEMVDTQGIDQGKFFWDLASMVDAIRKENANG